MKSVRGDPTVENATLWRVPSVQIVDCWSNGRRSLQLLSTLRLPVLVLLAFFALVAGLGATSANAEDGLTVDPSSPSGHEYAIPLEAAREQAAGQDAQTSSSRSSGAPSVPFGEGVGRGTTQAVSGKGSTDPGGSGATDTGGGSSGSTSRQRHQTAAAAERLTARQLATYRLADTGGTSSSWTVLMLVVGGIAVTLILLGRFSRRPSK